ncbi:sensor histidine kinase [Streptomyces olivaceoviridis]
MTSIADDLGSILDVMQQPAWAVDAEHRVFHANPLAADFLGHEHPTDLLGTDGRPAEFPGDVLRSHVAAHAAPSLRRGTLTHADGFRLPVEWTVVPLSRPDGAAAVYVFRPGAGAPTAAREPKEEEPSRALVARHDADLHRSAAATLQHGAQERLASLLLGLNLAREQVPPTAVELLDDAIRDAEAALGHVRDVTAELYPGVLRLRGLPAALTALAGQWPASVSVSGNLRERLPHAVEMHTYFLIREALRRAVHSARAGRVQVVVDLNLDLVVTVADDGATGEGLDPAPLASLADRVAVLDGSLSVRHATGEGTTVCAVIPVQPHTVPC